MTEANAFFVQFPHPGKEHRPPIDEMPWNTAYHRRKFLVAPGRYVEGDDGIHEAELVLWGEWEPPSRLERRWAPSGRLPTVLHRPYWPDRIRDGFRQNTDPWIWGDEMLYSNCRQVIGAKRRPTSMQRLSRGSVVCFGSTISGEFCIDTVFVVASHEPWMPAEVDDLDVDEAFKVCTGGSLATRAIDARVSLKLYRGATFDDPVEGMYSFVPARRADADDPRFARPSIQTEFVNPSTWRSTWGSKRPLTMDKVRSTWQDLLQQVLSAGLVLAVHLETPDRKRGHMVVP